MVLWGIFLGSFIMGFSGAVMPGPMLGITIDGSLRKGYKAAPLIVLGHGILEFTLVMVLAFGLKDFFANSIVSGFIGVFGGILLAWMGYGMIRSGFYKEMSLEHQKATSKTGTGLVLAGIIISITNPYFVLWWATTGLESIRQSYIIGLSGVIIFFLGHILADLVWYSFIGVIFSKGKKIINDLIYCRLVFILGIFITTFSVYFFISGCKILFS